MCTRCAQKREGERGGGFRRSGEKRFQQFGTQCARREGARARVQSTLPPESKKCVVGAPTRTRGGLWGAVLAGVVAPWARGLMATAALCTALVPSSGCCEEAKDTARAVLAPACAPTDVQELAVTYAATPKDLTVTETNYLSATSGDSPLQGSTRAKK